MRTLKLSIPAVVALLAALPAFAQSPFGEPVAIQLQGGAAPAAAPKAVVAEEWQVADKARIRATLEAWAEKAGWKVRWVPSDIDYTAENGQVFRGDFKVAARSMFEALQLDLIDPKLRIRMDFAGDNTPPLVLVTRDDGTKK